jgi:hypothetical protein
MSAFSLGSRGDRILWSRILPLWCLYGRVQLHDLCAREAPSRATSARCRS